MADVQFSPNSIENDQFTTGGKTYIFKIGGWRAKPIVFSDVVFTGHSITYLQEGVPSLETAKEKETWLKPSMPCY